MPTDPPSITEWQPVRSRVSQRYSQPRNVITPSEAFKRGFYGGLGLWCSFMVLNIIFALIAVASLIGLGISRW